MAKSADLNKDGKVDKTVNGSQFDDNSHQFPQPIDLKSSKYKWPTDAIQYNIGARKWGYLKDLYINFEFSKSKEPFESSIRFILGIS